MLSTKEAAQDKRREVKLFPQIPFCKYDSTMSAVLGPPQAKRKAINKCRPVESRPTATVPSTPGLLVTVGPSGFHVNALWYRPP